MTDGLKECQFCGSTDPEIRYDLMPNNMRMCKIACWHDAPAIYVECIGIGDTKEEAYEMAAGNWNTRYKRTCEWSIKKGGTFYDVYQCSACGYEYAESRTDHGIKVELIDAKFCPNCGAEVVNV